MEGLDGLSIARLADHVGMSKSGLFAHFKSKEDLQIATIDAAAELFDDREVTQPGMAAPPGLPASRASARRSSPTSSAVCGLGVSSSRPPPSSTPSLAW